MNRAIELHDSTLHDVVARGADRVIQLRPAYVHESLGVPGVHSGKGYLQDIDIVFGNARVDSLPESLPEDIWSGVVTVAGVASDNCISLPICTNERASFEATTIGGRSIQISGDSITAEIRGESSYLDEFDGAPMSNQSTDPTLSSGTPPAGQESRHP